MWESLEQTFDGAIYDVSATSWLIAAIALVVTVFGLGLIKRLLVGRLEQLSDRRMFSALSVVVKMLEKTTFVFYVAVGLHAAVLSLDLPERFERMVEVAVIVTVFFQLGRWASEGISQTIQRYRATEDEDPAESTALAALQFMARFLVWVGVLLLVLDNLGFDITALVASLGIGGVAVALAVQNILGDLFASLSIIVDKPFVIGDFIIVGDFMGTVEKIGLKTTRVRSLGGEQLIFSNTDLLKSRVRNYKRMEERRVVFEFGVVYQTATRQIERIPQMVREIIEGEEQTRFDRAHFKAFGESAFQFEVVYYVLSPDYNVYMDIHERIILEMLRGFRSEEIQFAYPTRTVHLEGKLGGATSANPTAVPA
ncbi:mechanosensitive ion channel family protein [Persicimonas caeni]|nr:mechanosensitive ion channel family protein [Persicimonas caeni]